MTLKFSEVKYDIISPTLPLGKYTTRVVVTGRVRLAAKLRKIIKIMSQMSRKIRLLALAFIVIIVAFVLTLAHGVSVERFECRAFLVEGLYIKLDKKLILNVSNLKIHKEKTPKSQTSLEQIASNIKKLKLIGLLFEEINLSRVGYENMEFSLVFLDDLFYLDTSFLSVNIGLSEDEEEDEGLIKGEVRELRFKDFNVTFNGAVSADLKHGIYDFTGVFTSYELSGKASAKMRGKRVDYNITDVSAPTIKDFMENLAKITELDPEIKNWIYGYITAENYHIDELSGHYTLGKDFDANSIFGRAHASNLKVKFETTLPPALISEANVTLASNALNFDLFKPTWEGKNLNGSRVQIKNLIEGKTDVVVSLATDSLLDAKVAGLLKAYDIDLGIIQKSGKMTSELRLDIFVEPFEVVPNGRFEPRGSNLNIGGGDFFTPSASVILEGDKVKIEKARLKNDIFDASFEGLIDVENENGAFNAVFDSVKVGGGEVLSMRNVKDKILMDFSNARTLVKTNSLGLELVLSEDENEIKIASLAPLAKYSNLMRELNATDGELSVATRDFENFDASLKTFKFEMGLADANGKPYVNDDFRVHIAKNGKVTGAAASGKIKFETAGEAVKLRLDGIGILVDSDDEDFSKKRVDFEGKNVSFFLTDVNRTLKFESCSGMSEGKNFDFNGKLGGGKLVLVRRPGSLYVDGLGLNDDFVNSMLNVNFFKGGNFDVRLRGLDWEHFKTQIKAQNTHLAGYKFTQKLLSFLDSVPALLSFRVPDFNDDGFSVNAGEMYIQRRANDLNISAAELHGTSADIAGVGHIDLESKAINVDLELKILKGATSIIGKIPLLNYIVLGADKTISTVIEVRGTLDEPKFETGVVGDILTTPFNLIKNILSLPFNLAN